MKSLYRKLAAARKSLTMWVNGIVITLVSFSDALPGVAPLVREYLPEEVWKYFGYYAAVMILIRFRNVEKTHGGKDER